MSSQGNGTFDARSRAEKHDADALASLDDAVGLQAPARRRAGGLAPCVDDDEPRLTLVEWRELIRLESVPYVNVRRVDTAFAPSMSASHGVNTMQRSPIRYVSAPTWTQRIRDRNQGSKSCTRYAFSRQRGKLADRVGGPPVRCDGDVGRVKSSRPTNTGAPTGTKCCRISSRSCMRRRALQSEGVEHEDGARVAAQLQLPHETEDRHVSARPDAPWRHDPCDRQRAAGSALVA